jgi:hypothetical protein
MYSRLDIVYELAEAVDWRVTAAADYNKTFKLKISHLA